MEFSGVMEIFPIVIGAVVTQAFTFVKNLQTAHLLSVHFIADNL